MGLSKEEKRAIKSERVKQILAETAKEMIHKAGVMSVSARKVTENAGYSPGTLYNHFKNIDELLWQTRQLLIHDIATHTIARSAPLKKKADFADAMKNYMGYFIAHPNVFRFFYFHHLSDDTKINPTTSEAPLLKEEMEKTFLFIMETGGFNPKEAEIVQKTFVYAMHGMLTLLISNNYGNDGMNKQTVFQDISAMVDLIFKKRPKSNCT